MKKNKILYILTILITLFTFNMNTDADSETPKFLTCVYKKTDNEGADNKVALQQITADISSGLSPNEIVYINTSNYDVTRPGWQKLNIQKKEYFNVEKDNYGRLKNCPGSITIRKETYSSQGCLDTNPNTECTTEEKNIIEYYGDKTSGKQELETTLLEMVDINEQPKDYDSNNPGYAPGNNPYTSGSTPTTGSQVDTYTTGKTCEAAVNDCKNRTDGHCEGGTGYLATCYYGKYLETESGCHLISISFPTKDEIKVNAIDPNYNTTVVYTGNTADFSPIKNAVIDNNGWCLSRIKVSRSVGTYQTSGYSFSYISEQKAGLSGYDNYYRISEKGHNIVEQTKLQSDNPDKKLLTGDFKITRYFDCASIFNDNSSKKLLKMIKFVINLVKIAIPILLIGLGILDFAKAIFSNKEDEMKKAQEKFMKRIIIGVCLFLVPTIIKFVLTIGNSVWGDVISADFCGIL